MKIFAAIFLIFLLTAGAFAASGTASDGNTRVELVYITEIGDSNLPIGDGNLINLASDDLTTGTFESNDGNRVRVGVFFTEFEITKYKLFINIINPVCSVSNLTNQVYFSIFSEMGDPITNIVYTLNGAPMDVNGICTGTGSSKTCNFFDSNIVALIPNTITILASNSLDVQYVSCNFTYNPGGGTGRTIIINPSPDWVMFLLIIIVIGGILLFLFYQRRR